MNLREQKLPHRRLQAVIIYPSFNGIRGKGEQSNEKSDCYNSKKPFMNIVLGRKKDAHKFHFI